MNEYCSSETVFDLTNRRQELEVLEAKASDASIWDDPALGQETLQKLAQVRSEVTPILDLGRRIDDLLDMADLISVEAEVDPELLGELEADLKSAGSELADYELKTLLTGQYDEANAILEVNAGAGGTESCDWAQMLFRMYTRWAEGRGFSVELTNETAGDVAGIKSATIIVTGKNAYGYLQGERGVHRLVRISPFDAAKKRHTSFASVDVIPEVEETTDVEINTDDLRIDTFRSSGAGGQHVNKTDSAVRITHIPSGIVVSCQNERSQHKNRAVAMKVLKARLLEIERRNQSKLMGDIRGEQQSIEWGSQIRSYVFQPYTMVKDHRTEQETGDVVRTMDGAIDPFIQAWLQHRSRIQNDKSDE